MKKLIVIVTHNGINHLKNLLEDIKSFNISNNEVCIVDNKSTNSDHLIYLQELKKEGYKILHNPNGGYNIGGYKYALDNLEADVWFLIQDSIRIKTNIFSQITPLLTNKNVYTFLTFACGLYDNNDDRSFLLINYGTTQYSKAAFPSSYFAKNEVLQKVKNEWIIPKNKIEAMGMERGTSVVFDRNNIKIIGLGIYTPNESGDPNAYSFFTKIYGGRAY